MMKRQHLHKTLVAVLLMALIPLTGLAAGTSASAMLQKAADRLSQAGSTSCNFTLTMHGGKSTGTLVLASDRFHIKGEAYEIWYDGITQWSLSGQTKEVTVIEPSPEELMQINPFAIVSAFRHGYDASFAPNSPAGTRTILLRSKSAKADVKEAAVTIASKTLDPVSVALTLADGNTATITVTNVKTSGVKNASEFKFDKKKYPGYSINDLR